MESWCTKMRSQPLDSLCKPYKLIFIAHQDIQEKLYYEYSPAAKEICYSFSDEMIVIMNEQWTLGRNTHGNVSKDKRMMIRYDYCVTFPLANLDAIS